MKKLTEDWKVKKRKTKNWSFKESIDLSFTNLEDLNKSSIRRKIAQTDNNKACIPNKTSTNMEMKNPCIKDGSTPTLRRSQRLREKSSEDEKEKKYFKYENSFQLHELTEATITDKAKENQIPMVDAKNTSLNADDGCDLSKWGLPPAVVQSYKSKNIDTMFQWQYECLSMESVLEGKNLVFSAPTSAGKTLVAEILMLKNVTETKKKAIMILPFVSVVREKVNYFQEMFQNAGIVVDGYMGAHNPPGGFKSVDIAICTIEKANNLINRLMEEKRLKELGILVVDELHMLGDYGRGYLLELLLTKLLYNCKKNNIKIQVVGMSATLPNLKVLSSWLNSELYHTDFRPVPLQEKFKVGNVIYDAKTKEPSRELNKLSLNFVEDSDHTIYLTIETITAGHGILIFCPSKNWCESLATSIAKEIYNIGRPNVSNGNMEQNILGEKLRKYLNGSELNDILQQLKNSPAGLDTVLQLTVPFGVAFHHAGLTFDERDIIEGGFRQGILKVLVATTTLSSGVNLPARRVIIRSPLFCGSAIDVLSYKQMVGRAGRKGIDEEGESILICKESERKVALSLVTSELRPVKSCLLLSGKNSLHSSLKRALIEVIASGAASTREEVLQYAACTLLYASLAKENAESSNDSVESSIDNCLNYLVDNDIIFISEEKNDGITELKYKPSQLGLAMLASGFSPEDALRVLKELQLARRNFVLENDLHILYEVTPPYLSDQMGSLNWMHYLNLWEQLPEEYKRVGNLVGVQESFIGLGVQGRINKNSYKIVQKIAIHQRFYAALALNDLIQEIPLAKVSEKYDCTRGILQSLQQTTSTFSGMLTIFCNRLKWHNLELLFSSFQRRVHFGIQQELSDLVRLSTLNAQRARSLYNAGFETVVSLANASPEELTLILYNMSSFESAKQLDGDMAQEALERYETKRLRITGKQGVSEKEAANLIIQEAQYFIKQELGIEKISWNSSNSKEAEEVNISAKSITSNDSTLSRKSGEFEIESNVKGKLSSTSAINTSRSKCLVDRINYSQVESLNSPVKSLSRNNILIPEKSPTEINSLTDIKSMLCKPETPLSVNEEQSNFHKKSNAQFSSNEPHIQNVSQMEAKSCIVTSLSKPISDDNIHLKENITKTKEFIFDSFIKNKDDDLDNMSFSEMLLSQTAEIGDVYFAQTSMCGTILKDNDSNEFGSLNSDLRNTPYRNSFITETTAQKDSEKNPSHGNSSFPLNNINNSGDNFLNESDINYMCGSFSFDLQKSAQCTINQPSVVLKNERSMKKSHENLKNKVHALLSKEKFQTHSTPKRDLENLNMPHVSEVPFAELNVHHQVSMSLKTLNACIDDESNLKKSNCSDSWNNSDKELLFNETSGDIFESEDSFSVDKKGNEKCKCVHLNSEKIQLNQKCEKSMKSLSETSNDLFDDEFLNNSDKITNIKIVDGINVVQPLQKDLNSSQVCTPPNITFPTSQFFDEKTSFFDSIPLERELKYLAKNKTTAQESCEKKCTEIQTNEENNLFPKQDNHSQFWKSWESSPCSITSLNLNHNPKSVSSSFNNESRRKSSSLNLDSSDNGLIINLNQNSKNGKKSSSLNLDSDDNSLFTSFTSDYLFLTPEVKKFKNSTEHNTHISAKISSTYVCKKNKSSIQNAKDKTNIYSNEDFESQNTTKSNKFSNIYQNLAFFVSGNIPPLEIIDVLDIDFYSFLTALKEIPVFSFSLACEKRKEKAKSIGPPKQKDNQNCKKKDVCVIEPDIIVKGISISFGGPAFYIPFTEDTENSSLKFEVKMNSIQQFFYYFLQNKTVIAYDVKSQYKILWQGCNISLVANEDTTYFDPTVAAWLLDPVSGMLPLHILVQNYLPQIENLFENRQNNNISLGLDFQSTESGKERASFEAYVVYHLMAKLLEELKTQELYSSFADVEMPSVIAFAKMEQNGFGFNSDLAISYQQDLQKKQQDILDKSYAVAGRRFNISSSKDISRVLYKELKLNVDLSPDSPKIQKHLAIGSTSRRLPPELKTNKECLEKIIHLHPLPKAILDWRRLSFATTKVLMPLLRHNKFDSFFNMNRLYSTSYIYTLTGRVHMHSPNLQFVPKDFNIENIATKSTFDDIDNDKEAYALTEEEEAEYGVNIRNLFIPSKGNILVAADYSQLELRMLAHLSADEKLLQSLNSNEDIFKKIASGWKKVPVTLVSTEMREQAKKICYGMIYGIGIKTLSQQLKSSESEALMFMESFKNSYSSLEVYLQSVIKSCRMKGYITTLMQRHRYLPLIKSVNKSERSHAERQAINTTIQGSAADLIKSAMIDIEKQLQNEFPEVSSPLSFQNSYYLKHERNPKEFRGGILVLQMHDELIYEVNERDLETVIQIIKKGMEKTIQLSVKLPIKIRVGTSWGSMKEIS